MPLLNLLIQPSDNETNNSLLKIGFQPFPNIPQLLYCSKTKEELSSIFLKIGKVVSESSQTRTRYFLTRSPLQPDNLLEYFLQAQPLNTIIEAIKYSWFFETLAGQHIFFKYQPIFNLDSGEIVGYECLARSKNKWGQILSGYQLFEAAIATNLTYGFDEMARIKCLETIAEIKADKTFYINILPNSIIRDRQFLKQNLEQILTLGLVPEQIVFELTELEALAKCPELPQIIKQMQEWGFRIALDDLCGGVSLDHYVMEFRPDVLKLDRRLVHGCSQHSMKQILLKSLLDSAHELNIMVIAEGLEKIEDIQFCRALGVDCGQGYGLAMPEITLRHHPLDLPEFNILVAC